MQPTEDPGNEAPRVVTASGPFIRSSERRYTNFSGPTVNNVATGASSNASGKAFYFDNF